ncbi:MAG: LysR family transcriptional regulator [Pseudomonadota bacterium]
MPTMINWNELRTALIVARRGTVSAAADELGVHRATVHRHIDLLEDALAAKLFQRHQKGYSLTDDGREMLEVANRMDEMCSVLAGTARKRAGQLSGDLILSTVAGVSSLLLPTIKLMREMHPEINVELVVDDKLCQLEYGEAHIAFRAGPQPTFLDYVVQRFRQIRFGLYASRSYVDRHGLPTNENFDGHKFIVKSAGLTPRSYTSWLQENVAADQIAFTTNKRECMHDAILAGLGLGFIADHEADRYTDLVEVPLSDETMGDLWIVTHVDLHRSAKVRAFLDLMKNSQNTMRRAS